MKGLRWCVFGAIALVLLTGGIAGRAQVVRINKITGVRPRLTLGSMTLAATPGTVTFGLVHGGTATGSVPVTLMTTYSIISVGGPISLYGYFSTTNALTTTAGDIIPSSAVFGLCATGSPTSYTAFTATSPFATGSSLLVWQVTGALNLGLAGSRTDSLSLQINLSAKPQQPAGAYTGTLNLVVQAL